VHARRDPRKVLRDHQRCSPMFPRLIEAADWTYPRVGDMAAMFIPRLQDPIRDIYA